MLVNPHQLMSFYLYWENKENDLKDVELTKAD